MTFLPQMNPVGAKLKIVFNITHQGRTLFTHLSHVRHFNGWALLFHFFWTDAVQHPLSVMIQLKRSKTIFYITPTGFIRKQKVTHT